MHNTVAAFLTGLITIYYCGIVIADEATKPTNDQTSSGPLILPDDEDTGVEKKCLTICQEWGESCFINPRTGNRKCRRTCKQLGKECI